MILQFHGPRGSVDLFSVKPPAVAGMFYPADPQALRREVDRCLAAVETAGEPAPKAIIAPHAGYRYSGAVAASAYARLRAGAGTIRRVVLLGPNHRVPVRGIAASGAGAFDTPIGAVQVDREGVRTALRFPQVAVHDEAFAEEHSLEVHLPFLIRTLESFRIVPLLVGEAEPEAVSEVIAALWGGPETAIVISSDLSHYHDYATARRLDAATSRAIETLRYESLDYASACGRNAVGGLLHLARARHVGARTVDLRNSGDTAGPADRVVGYGAWVFHEPGGRLDLADRRVLLGIAANSIRHGLEHGRAKAVDAAALPETLRAARATFVTLELDGRLRGCVGSLAASRPLAQDVAYNAWAAAFADGRFSPVTAEEAPRLHIKVSVLSEPEPIACESEEALIALLRPGVDGLILEEGKRRSTFLPAVWKGLPDPRAFLAHLKRKGGFAADYWSPNIRVSRYTTESFD